MLRKLKIKIVCVIMTIVTIMICIIMGLILFLTSKNMEANSVQMMESYANEPPILRVPSEIKNEVQLPFFSVQLGENGEIMGVGGGYYDLSDLNVLLEILEATNDTHQQVGVLQEYGFRFYRAASPMGQNIVFADMSTETKVLEQLVRICIAMGIISFFAFLLISILLVRWIVKPVEQSWNQQKQFIADASHELKTPLTVILTNTELLQNGRVLQGQEELLFSGIETMSRQMRGLVESLLELARVDNGLMRNKYEQICISEVVENAVFPFEPVFFEKGLTLEVSIDPDLYMKGNEEYLSQVVEILLDNAQKYSTPNGMTKISLKNTCGKYCLLTVANTGEQMKPDELKKIFRRFYRADTVRGTDGSYGLGLSIAKGIVENHRGKIWAESKNGWNYFIVSFPMCKKVRKK